MKTILAFGDSNTYGLNPYDKSRYDINTRWTGILHNKISKYDFRVVEEGLCGRTTVFHDTKRNYRRGTDTLPFLLESHNPIDCVILMLGTNDCKCEFHATPQMIADGIKKLIHIIHEKCSAEILLISPILLADGIGEPGYDTDFSQESVTVSRQLKDKYRTLAMEENCMFLAASDYASPSPADREHLDDKGHSTLAYAIFKKIYDEIILHDLTVHQHQ